MFFAKSSTIIEQGLILCYIIVIALEKTFSGELGDLHLLY